jgi:prophage regulatory protein
MDMDRDVLTAKDELKRLGLTRGRRAMDDKNGVRRAGKDSPFYSLEQVLELVPVSRSTLYRMRENGEFPKGIKLGMRSVAWSKKEVQAWIDEKLDT